MILLEFVNVKYSQTIGSQKNFVDDKNYDTELRKIIIRIHLFSLLVEQAYISAAVTKDVFKRNLKKLSSWILTLENMVELVQDIEARFLDILIRYATFCS